MKALTVWRERQARSYIAGVLHGDGWLTALTIGLRCKDEDFARAFADAVNSVYGFRLIPCLDERGYWLARSSNKRSHFAGAKDHDPTTAIEQTAWLRGLFDSEGNAQLLAKPARGPNSYHRRVAFYSTEPATLTKASGYLTALGILHTRRSTTNSASHKGTKTVEELRITRKDSFAMFADVVSSSINRKRVSLYSIVGSYAPPGAHALAQAKGVEVRRQRQAAGGRY